jgi:hypothetical protein
MSKDHFKKAFAVVKGLKHLPLDMLRYDRCFPAGERWAYRGKDDGSGGITLSIVARYKHDGGKWTPDRWKTFGWEVIWMGDSYDDAERAADAEIERLGLARKGEVVS